MSLSAYDDEAVARLAGPQRALVYEVSRAFSELIELSELIPLVIARCNELLNAESSAVLLLDDERREFYFPYITDVAPDVEQRFSDIRFPADRGIAGWVLKHRQVQVVKDVTRDPRWYGDVDGQTGMVTHSVLCAPLRTRQDVLGVIELRNKRSGEFDQDDATLLTALADSIAVAIENAQLYGTVKDTADRLRDEVVALHREVVRHTHFGDLIGNSPGMRRVYELMESAIASPVTVLIRGETGTGKELIARAIHYNGARRERPFVAVNCGALQETLLESELFGHKKGAFTGALSDRKGLFEVAHGGTIFLDEIGDTPPAMRTKLLRVLQEGEILPVGETRPRKVDVRVISATHHDLEAAAATGEFREDLYYRLSTFPIHVPPLRERREDIPSLAARLLERTAQKFSKSVGGLSPAVIEMFTEYHWPGNVRELQNEIERAVALAHAGEAIGPEHLSERLGSPTRPRPPSVTQPMSLRRARALFEQEYIAEILRQHGGNASQAAKVLGISRALLQDKIKIYGLRKKAAAAAARTAPRRPVK